MNVGLHFLSDDYPIVLGAATFLDTVGGRVGMQSPERMVRIFYKGRPDVASVAQKARTWHAQGCRIQIGNEPNLPLEGFGGVAADYAAWFLEVANLCPADVRLYYAGISPGDPNWRGWYTHPMARAAIARAHGIVVHAYGALEQIKEVVWWVYRQFPDKPLWLGEFNFGAGQSVDRDAWAKGTLRPLLDWLQTVPTLEAATYFAWRWPSPDAKLPTPVDAQGTEIEGVLRTWQPKPQPKEPPKMLRIVDLSNYQGVVDMNGWDDIDGAIVRVSEDGSPLDQFAPLTVAQLRKRGKLVGLYHLTDPRFATPVQSLDTFKRGMANVGGLLPGEVPFNDAEQGNPGDNAPWQAQWGRGFADTEGFKAGFYSAPWWMDPHNLSHEGVAREYSCLWEAKYTGDPATKPDDLPGWFEVMVQYTASGAVPGVQGNVDLNTFLGSREDWLKLGKPGLIAVPAVPDLRASIGELEAALARVKQAAGVP